MESNNGRNVQVILKTQTSYQIPAEPYMLPVAFRRYHLSQLINQVLSLPTPVPFDFIINGEILSSTLGDWCVEKKLGEEEIIEIEYIPSVLPPQKISSLPHSDWVSSVSVAKKGYFLTGSYDTEVRVFNESHEVLHTVSGHTGPVSDVSWIPHQNPDAMLIISSSYDTTARISSIEGGTARGLASLHLHTASVSSIRANGSGTHLLTASWDHLIGLWTSDIPEEDEVPVPVSSEEPTRKRRKLATSSARTDVHPPKRKAPSTVLKSHTGRVSKALFSLDDDGKAFSSGWDCTVGLCTGTATSPERAMVDLALSADSRSILGGLCDRNVLLYSASDFPSNLQPIMFTNTSAPVAIQTHPTSPHHFLAACQDGMVRLWDIRSSKNAVASFEGFTDVSKRKITSVEWGREDVVAVGGEEGVCISRAAIR
ncbi:hypothetical protein BS47DRAFT_1375651 [Hydnum rufescens UP504]|uniref:NLE domain-containing protein n=1 Tax=Hydnum rufescens UP504 TaxID=1448309 RepID=A0A9P6DWI8_9AGAM|nr:hypothetical protein BS47DRAFT_1375651 [Hydnum rufescens UP504]